MTVLGCIVYRHNTWIWLVIIAALPSLAGSWVRASWVTDRLFRRTAGSSRRVGWHFATRRSTDAGHLATGPVAPEAATARFNGNRVSQVSTMDRPISRSIHGRSGR